LQFGSAVGAGLQPTVAGAARAKCTVAGPDCRASRVAAGSLRRARRARAGAERVFGKLTLAKPEAPLIVGRRARYRMLRCDCLDRRSHRHDAGRLFSISAQSGFEFQWAREWSGRWGESFAIGAVHRAVSDSDTDVQPRRAVAVKHQTT